MNEDNAVGIKIKLITIPTLHLRWRNIAAVLERTNDIDLVRPAVLYIYLQIMVIFEEGMLMSSSGKNSDSAHMYVSQIQKVYQRLCFKTGDA